MIKKYKKLIIKKFVIEKSKVKIFKFNNDKIWNCSNGAKIINFGEKGFEPLNNRVKNDCLSTWPHSNYTKLNWI